MRELLVPSLLAASLISPLAGPCLGQYLRHELSPTSTTDLSAFGTAVAVDAERILVGNPGTLTNDCHVFDADTGSFLQLLEPPAGSQDFGGSVALAGPVALVGDPRGNAAPFPGNLRGYDLATGSVLWFRKGVLPNGRFGYGLDVFGDRVLVSNGGGGGATMAHLLDTTAGSTLFELSPPAGSSFGEAVALSASWIVIGHGGDDTLGTDAGTVFVYDAATGAFVTQLFAPSSAPGEEFGYALDLDGDLLAVSAPFHRSVQTSLANLQSGIVHLFDLSSGTWTASLSPEAPEAMEHMGTHVQITDQWIVANADFSNLALDTRGSQHVFRRDTLEPVGQRTTFRQPGQAGVDPSAPAMAAHGNTLVVGDPKSFFLEPGLTQVYSLGDDAPGQPYCGPAAANSTGQPATIARSWGGDLNQGSYLYLLAHGLPLQEFGYFLASQDAAFVPNAGGSQGNLCLGGSPRRLLTATLNLQSYLGTLPLALDLDALPGGDPLAVLPGDTWNFQLWYRDGGTSNFSEGWRVTF